MAPAAGEARPHLRSVPDRCAACSRDLKEDQTILFVEEENGRIFCSEDCIVSLYAPEIETLEREYFRKLPADEMSAKEREALSHLRWKTLEKPGEVWRNKTATADFRYTFVAEYEKDGEPFWSVALCLCLRGEPSFLFLAFITRSPEMVDAYRSGERVEAVRNESDDGGEGKGFTFLAESPEAREEGNPTDRLGAPWTQYETFQADVFGARKKSDIPEKDYQQYETCFEGTLSEPGEVWSYPSVEGDDSSPRIFHFIRQYGKPKAKAKLHWYVIVARQTPQPDQLEVLEAFPTKDAKLVGRYRHGVQEPVTGEEASASNASSGQNRIVH